MTTRQLRQADCIYPQGEPVAKVVFFGVAWVIKTNFRGAMPASDSKFTGCCKSVMRAYRGQARFIDIVYISLRFSAKLFAWHRLPNLANHTASTRTVSDTHTSIDLIQFHSRLALNHLAHLPVPFHGLKSFDRINKIYRIDIQQTRNGPNHSEPIFVTAFPPILSILLILSKKPFSALIRHQGADEGHRTLQSLCRRPRLHPRKSARLLRPELQRDALEAGIILGAPGRDLGTGLESVVDDAPVVGIEGVCLDRAGGYCERGARP